jgi:hypothetical protein
MIQLIFVHIYVSSVILPASIKIPLSAMEKMENLNFFAYPHARGIEYNFFDGLLVKSPIIFQQYNIDVYFTRSFYAVIIINIIYLGWFVILALINHFVNRFAFSDSKFIKFFRNIPRRPINYFDQIWRYQFFTTMWASFLQFYNFNATDGREGLNLAICIIAFVISLIWPIFVMIYTYRRHFKLNVNHFLYLYEDIYYRKISSVADNIKYYTYIAIRFGRYLFYGIFIALFINHEVIGPVILILVNLIELIYVFHF